MAQQRRSTLIASFSLMVLPYYLLKPIAQTKKAIMNTKTVFLRKPYKAKVEQKYLFDFTNSLLRGEIEGRGGFCQQQCRQTTNLSNKAVNLQLTKATGNFKGLRFSLQRQKPFMDSYRTLPNSKRGKRRGPVGFYQKYTLIWNSILCNIQETQNLLTDNYNFITGFLAPKLASSLLDNANQNIAQSCKSSQH